MAAVAQSPVLEIAALARDIVGPDWVVTDGAQLRVYECDGLKNQREVPGAVVLPGSTEQVAAVVRLCHERGVPFVARGAGSGLSGGAMPKAEGVVIGLSRLREVLDIDVPNQRARVQPGVTNLRVSEVAGPHGLYYAPDPSSQQVCTIGGNLAENAGGAHCLKYGFTTNHVLTATVVLSDGTIVEFGSEAPDAPGLDLLGVLIGSEGTVAIVTEALLNLLPKPQHVETLVAMFPSSETAGEAVSMIIAEGIVPAAVEMMDRLAIDAAKTQTPVTWDTEAALIVELDGPVIEVQSQFEAVTAICERCGADGVQVAASPAERLDIWRARKSAFAAVGAIAPAYLVQDGVIPRTRLPEVLNGIRALADANGVRVANVFHAGDGNLHPLVLYDNKVEGEQERAEKVAIAIIELCVDFGGSITGEHGVGVEKICSMQKMFTGDDLTAFDRVRSAFDPDGLCNPDKLLPTPRLCGEVPGFAHTHRVEAAGLGERM
ncbi:MAG: FAD-linked oxidase C-terminal domain-containing protein [Thermoleophilia bacterium]